MTFLVPIVRYLQDFQSFVNLKLFSYYIKTLHESYTFFFSWSWIIFDRITTSESLTLKGQSPLNDFNTKFVVTLWFTLTEWLPGGKILKNKMKYFFRHEIVQLHLYIERTAENKSQGFNLNYVKTKLEKNYGMQLDSTWKLYLKIPHKYGLLCTVYNFFFWLSHRIQAFEKQ